MNNRITKMLRIAAAVGLLVLAVGFFTLPASAQKAGPADFMIGNKGEIHFNVPVKAGSAVLEPGMYQVQHVVEGSDHVVTFKEMQMPAGYRHGNTPISKVVAVSLACTTEPAAKVSSTKVTLRTNKAGDKEIAEVQIAGETIKHKF
jgi:hypothetical protein